MFAKRLFGLVVAVFGFGSWSTFAMPINPSAWTGQSYGGYENLLLFKWENVHSHDLVGLYVNDDFQDWRDYTVSWYQTDGDVERIPGTTGKYLVEPGSIGLIAIGLAALSLTRRTLRKSGASRGLP